jgi:hypothetical protein
LSHLIGCCVKVGHGNIGQVVLYRVQDRWDKQLHKVVGLQYNLFVQLARQVPHALFLRTASKAKSIQNWLREKEIE